MCFPDRLQPNPGVDAAVPNPRRRPSPSCQHTPAASVDFRNNIFKTQSWLHLLCVLVRTRLFSLDTCTGPPCVKSWAPGASQPRPGRGRPQTPQARRNERRGGLLVASPVWSPRGGISELWTRIWNVRRSARGRPGSSAPTTAGVLECLPMFLFGSGPRWPLLNRLWHSHRPAKTHHAVLWGTRDPTADRDAGLSLWPQRGGPSGCGPSAWPAPSGSEYAHCSAPTSLFGDRVLNPQKNNNRSSCCPPLPRPHPAFTRYPWEPRHSLAWPPPATPPNPILKQS